MKKLISFSVEILFGLAFVWGVTGDLARAFTQNPALYGFFAAVIIWRAMEQWIVGSPYVASGDYKYRYDDKWSLTLINMVLWGIMLSSLTEYSITAHDFTNSRVQIIQSVGISLMLLGTLIRYIAIKQLGEFFTFDLIIRDNHRLITSGIFAYMRHPAYAGAMILSFGVPLALLSKVGLVLAVAIGIPARLHRMNHEDRVLSSQLGQEYAAYASRVKKLIPFLY